MSFNQEISSLNLSRSQLKTFREKGCFTVQDLRDNPDIISPARLEQLTKVPETKTALQLLEEENSSKFVLSFIESLDVVLQDVLRDGLITELVGLPGSGRTRLCLHLSISGQVQDDCICAETVYICTNMNFSVSLLREIAEGYIKKCSIFKKCNIEEILKRIHYISVMSNKAFQDCLKYLEEYLNGHTVSLIIIDSITYPLRQVERSEKTSVIYTIMQELRQLSDTFKFTVVLTNDMTTGPSDDTCVVPSLRDTFYHIINTRIVLSKKDNTFQAELLKSSVKFPMKCEFNFLTDIT